MGKGGKILNPADKARKEARKRELKKNKKQRQQVRSEAIEKRNPEQIIAELESLDKQEYDPDNRPAQSAVANIEQMFKDKRKRLRGLLERILAHYRKEDKEKYVQLKKLEAEYETKHQNLEKQYKLATEVKLAEVIPPTLADHTKPPPLPPQQTSTSHANQRLQHEPPQMRPASHHHHQTKPQIDRQPPLAKAQVSGIQARSTTILAKPVVESKPVIESKPVRFVPKVTKFVPASVRAKIAPTKQQTKAPP